MNLISPNRPHSQWQSTLLFAAVTLLIVQVVARAQDPIASLQNKITTVYDGVSPSIVSIARVRRDRLNSFDALPFNRVGRGLPLIDPTRTDYIPTEFGTGIVFSAAGDVLTCFHVLDDPSVNDYWIWHQGKVHRAAATAHPATVRAGDPWTDLAVLRIGNVDVHPLVLESTPQPRIGQLVLVLGNPYAIARDGRASMAWGMISNLQRPSPQPAIEEGVPSGKQSLHEYGTLLQLDAKINLGTSGGAVVDLDGRLIGIVTSLAALAGYEQSAGFAIPIDGPAKSVIEALQRGKRPEFGFLGVEPVDLEGPLKSQGLSGALVRRVITGFPGDVAGLRPGSVVTAIDGQPINDAAELFREVSRRPAQQDVRMTVLDIDQPKEKHADLTVRLGKKHIETSRPSYSIEPEPSWCGMSVDWSTALPPERLFDADLVGSKPPPVAITKVDPGQPAWQAGLRPGMFVIGVADLKIETPNEFYKAVAASSSETILRIIGDGGRLQTIQVENE